MHRNKRKLDDDIDECSKKMNSMTIKEEKLLHEFHQLEYKYKELIRRGIALERVLFEKEKEILILKEIVNEDKKVKDDGRFFENCVN